MTMEICCGCRWAKAQLDYAEISLGTPVFWPQSGGRLVVTSLFTFSVNEIAMYDIFEKEDRGQQIADKRGIRQVV